MNSPNLTYKRSPFNSKHVQQVGAYSKPNHQTTTTTFSFRRNKRSKHSFQNKKQTVTTRMKCFFHCTVNNFKSLVATASVILVLCLIVFFGLLFGGVLHLNCGDDTGGIGGGGNVGHRFYHDNPDENLEALNWWRKANFYHIYIRSFKDSDGNGDGDLRGIIQKLDYLKLIGIDTVLMSPFFSSPMKDGGYDIDNFVAVNPMFGTLQDIKDLFDGAHERGMHVVIDFVPNHSSNQHPWFQCSERALIDPKCAKYKDYYIWREKVNFQDPIEGPKPNNWVSMFGNSSAWTWSETRKSYYFHHFMAEQPDLNYRNPSVREEFREIARFWIRLGADGIRVDAPNHLIEDELFRDEPVNVQYNYTFNIGYDRLKHVYVKSSIESLEILRDWKEVTEEKEFKERDLVIIAETYDTHDRVLPVYGPTPYYRYADMPFSFFLQESPVDFILNKYHLVQPNYVAKQIDMWLRKIRHMHWPRVHGARDPWTCWVVSNHDKSRPFLRYGEHGASAMMYLLNFLFGSPTNYYGDELNAMEVDPNKVPERTVNGGEATRLGSRGVMAWLPSAEGGAGFSTNDSTWMPPADNFKTHNVETQLEDYLKHGKRNEMGQFMKMLALRKQLLSTVMFAEVALFENSDAHSSLLALARIHKKHLNLLILINFNYDNSTTVNLKPNSKTLRYDSFSMPESMFEDASMLPKEGKVLLANYEDKVIKENNTIMIENLALGPHQGIILGFEPVLRYFDYDENEQRKKYRN